MKTKMMLALVAILVAMVAGAVPAFAQTTEIAVTGVVEDEQDKMDGMPIYGIQDKSNLPGMASPQGYLLEGNYSAYVGRRITVYGIPKTDAGHRILGVTRIE